MSASHDFARVVSVIETTLARRGNGRTTIMRGLTQYWSLDGELLAEVDPCAGRDRVSGDGPRAAVLAWAASPGFAAVHNAQATNEAIADHLIAWLREAGFEIVAINAAA